MEPKKEKFYNIYDTNKSKIDLGLYGSQRDLKSRFNTQSRLKDRKDQITSLSVQLREFQKTEGDLL